MTSQERLSVDAAAARLGISPDAVRSRIKRGTLWAIRRNGRVRVVLRTALAQEGTGREGTVVAGPGASSSEGQIATQGANETDPAKDEAAIRLRARPPRRLSPSAATTSAGLSSTRHPTCASKSTTNPRSTPSKTCALRRSPASC